LDIFKNVHFSEKVGRISTVFFKDSQKWICDSFLDKRPKGATREAGYNKNLTENNRILFKSTKKTRGF
jgi:hypothetical protein